MFCKECKRFTESFVVNKNKKADNYKILVITKMYQLIEEINNRQNQKKLAVTLHLLSAILIICYIKTCTLLVDLEHPFKIGFSIIAHMYFFTF